MKTIIRRIGNSQGIILPQSFIKAIGSPTEVNLVITEDGGIYITPSTKSIRRKPRNIDEKDGFYFLMKTKLDNSIKTGQTKWISDKEVEIAL